MNKRSAMSVVTVITGLCVLCPPAHSQTPIPGDITSAGLSYITPDTPVWYNTNQLAGHPFPGYVTNGPIYNLDDQLPTKEIIDGGNHGNWEPYISVMGDTTFLVGCGIFADDGSWNNSTNHIGVTGNQRYVLTLQPAAGGKPKTAEVFYDDFGQPYALHQMMRQRNPGVRVAGDKRIGATNFVSGGSSALMYGKHWFGIDYFNTDGRLNTSYPLYGTGFPSDCNNACSGSPPGTWDTQWAFLQPFSLNPTTLIQSPLAKAFDPIFFPAWTNSPLPGTGNNVSYFGGDVVALSDGNYVVVVDDYTGFFGGASPGNPSGAAAKIFRSDGSSVKDTWLVDTHEIWANVAAYKGGFAVRVQSLFYFYDNAGNPIATNTVAASSGVAFDQGRGDGARTASDIRSHYVYLASPVNLGGGSNVVMLGVWDGRNGAFVTNAIVTSDLDPTFTSVDRVNLAANALDQVCVAFDGKADLTAAGLQNQMIARVMHFDGQNVSYLTPSFFPFISSDNTNNINANGILGFTTQNPSVAMTSKAICIAAKATINSTNDPAGGPDSGLETTVYTVITAPIPSASAIGLTNIVPDMLLWYSTNNYYTNGPMTVGAATTNAGVFDAYPSVLGDSTFVVANVVRSQDYGDGLNDLAFGLAFQPTTGGAPKLGYAFWDDYGKPFQGVISGRQSGPPGRVGADKRYGAANFITGANCNAGNPVYSGTNFQSNSRWSLNPGYSLGSSRYAVEQIFSLNPATLAQTPLTLTTDFLGDAPNTAYGEVLALDNGNFAVVIDDSAKDIISQEAPAAVIVAPNGSIVTPFFAIAPGDTSGQGLWANCAAYKGGFCVRYHANLYFFDNSGNAQGSVTQSTSGILFDTSRGDTTRLASDIRSHYVYLAGAPLPSGSTPTTGQPVMLAIWDANTRTFVAATNVSSDIPVAQMKVNAVNVGVDALDRVTVAWDCIPSPSFGAGVGNTANQGWQIIARVMAFDGAGAKISYLTPSFFPFVNSDPSGLLSSQGLTTETPGIAMTPQQICISCKGTFNSTNNPAAGVDTPPTTTPGGSLGGLNMYTVLSHPAPVAAPRPLITVTHPDSTHVTISWPAEDGLFTVQSRTSFLPTVVWGNVTTQNVPTPVTVSIGAGPTYFRLVR